MPRPIIRNTPEGPFIVKKLSNPGSFSRDIILLNEKQKEKLIKKIESIVRGSDEYKDYILYLKDYMDMRSCGFYKRVDNKYGKKVSIEVHHEPFTLFDLVNVVVDKWLKNDWQLNYYKIGTEVLRLHYTGLVGLYPVSITIHQMVHAGQLFIPTYDVKGDYKAFMEMYDEYISKELKSKIAMKEKLSNEECNDYSKLNKKFVYLEVDGWELPKLIS